MIPLLNHKFIQEKKSLILISLIFILGFGLRIYNLSSESYWLDETYSVLIAREDLSKVYSKVVRFENNPPLYFVLLHRWIKLFGESEFSVRFLSVLFGSLAILLIYKVATLLFDKNVGFLSALLLSISKFHIYYSQEARYYSILSFITLLSFYFFINLLKRGDLITILGYVGTTILLLYTHVFGFFILFAQNLIFFYFLFSRSKFSVLSIKKWILLQPVMVLLFLPWLPFIYVQIARVEHRFWIPEPTLQTLGGTIVKFGGSIVITIIFITLSIMAIIRNRKRDSFEKIVFLTIWLIFPILIAFIISKFSAPIYTHKYLIGASCAFLILTAVGVFVIKKRIVRLLIISIIIMLSIISLLDYYKRVDKPQWRETASFVDMYAKKKDLVLFNLNQSQIPFLYYSKSEELDVKSLRGENEFFSEKNILELENLVKKNKRIWFIWANSQGNPNSLWFIRSILQKSHGIIQHQEYFGIDVTLFSLL